MDEAGVYSTPCFGCKQSKKECICKILPCTFCKFNAISFNEWCKHIEAEHYEQLRRMADKRRVTIG